MGMTLTPSCGAPASSWRPPAWSGRLRSTRRRPSPGVARASPERTRQRRAPKAGRRAGRRAAPLGRGAAANTSIRCSGRSSRTTGASSGPRALRACIEMAMDALPLSRPRLRHVGDPGRRRGHGLRPAARRSSIGRCCSSRSSRCRRHRGTQGDAAADHQRIDDVGVVRGGLRIAAAARPARDDAGGRRQRVQPVPPEQQGAAIRCIARSSAWRRSCVTVQGAGLAFWPARSRRARPRSLTAVAPAAGRRRDGVLPAQHGARRRGHRPGVAGVDCHDLADQLPLERAELLRRRRHGRRCGAGASRSGLLAGAARPSRRST